MAHSYAESFGRRRAALRRSSSAMGFIYPVCTSARSPRSNMRMAQTFCCSITVAMGRVRGQVYIHGFSMGAAIALLLPPHPAVAGLIADSPYARLDEMTLMLIAQILDQQTAGWRGLARVLRTLIPSLTRLTFLGGQLLFHARYRH